MVPNALAALLHPRPAAAQATGTPIPVQAAVSIEPDTVRIGDPFLVQIGIRAPTGATIAFPPPPDTTGAVQGLDPVRVETRPDSGGLVQWGYYRVVAWDIGEQPIALGDVIVTFGGRSRRISLAGHKVFVASVLPADTAQRIPKPARPLYEFNATPWWVWPALAAAVLLLLLVWWWLRRRKRGKPIAVPDPFARAEREFARIEALGLVDAGERGRYVALIVEVLRDYLAARYAKAPLCFLHVIQVTRTLALDAELPAQISRGDEILLRAETEAQRLGMQTEKAPAQAREIGREARAIVAQVHAATLPAPAMEKAA